MILYYTKELSFQILELFNGVKSFYLYNLFFRTNNDLISRRRPIRKLTFGSAGRNIFQS